MLNATCFFQQLYIKYTKPVQTLVLYFSKDILKPPPVISVSCKICFQLSLGLKRVHLKTTVN